MKGLGDVVNEFTTKTGIKYIVKGVAKAAHSAGITDTDDCGCQARQDALNKAVPFK